MTDTPDSPIVVPDSIEPYIGYKSLVVCELETLNSVPELVLCSPQQGVSWPKKQRLVAGHPPYTTENHPQHHSVAASQCLCGIYAVDHPSMLAGYFGFGCVAVKVALWGRTTKASHGARAQYAYPQEIIAWAVSDELAQKVAEEYGIPIRKKRDKSLAIARAQTEYMMKMGVPMSAPFLLSRSGVQVAGGASSGGSRSVQRRPRSLAPIAVWALPTLVGMIGFNNIGGRPAMLAWWLLCLVAWVGYLQKHHN